VVLVQAQYQGGLVDFNRVFTTQLQLMTQQDQLVIARGNIASSLIAVHRALGGGWHCVENRPAPAPHVMAANGPQPAGGTASRSVARANSGG
jgi:outer membrane protein TolC